MVIASGVKTLAQVKDLPTTLLVTDASVPRSLVPTLPPLCSTRTRGETMRRLLVRPTPGLTRPRTTQSQAVVSPSTRNSLGRPRPDKTDSEASVRNAGAAENLGFAPVTALALLRRRANPKRIAAAFSSRGRALRLHRGGAGSTPRLHFSFRRASCVAVSDGRARFGSAQEAPVRV